MSAKAPTSTAAAEAIKPRGDLDRDARFLTTFTLSLLSVLQIAPIWAYLPLALTGLERCHFNAR